MHIEFATQKGKSSAKTCPERDTRRRERESSSCRLSVISIESLSQVLFGFAWLLLLLKTANLFAALSITKAQLTKLTLLQRLTMIYGQDKATIAIKLSVHNVPKVLINIFEASRKWVSPKIKSKTSSAIDRNKHKTDRCDLLQVTHICSYTWSLQPSRTSS